MQEDWRHGEKHRYMKAQSLHQWIINTLDKRMKEVLEEVYRQSDKNEE